ncbi:GNAT family N-acetyltransferase [Nakamurella endophytica]|uniref:UPF0256 protein n=1 Tax=Nakamurella endophytica TaxID=1748367 RepID=A0A917WIW4_9ACTN|nr:GNAT family N-acetyltransferase [Nakamurella endophytica]GGM06839.1 UPF0256 protein [Nakamurella endophytica]
MASGTTVRPLRPEELDSALQLDAAAFGWEPEGDWMDAVVRPTLEVERFTGVFDPALDDEMVGVAGIFSKEMTFPGGGRTPVAGVTWVSVRPGQQGRGILRQLMQDQLTGLHERGQEPVAVLTASESGIYGRFGYGSAIRRARLEIPQGTALRAGLETDRVRVVPRERAFDTVTALYDQVAAAAPGHLRRTPEVWQSLYSDHSVDRDGATRLVVALHPDGYASYRVKADWNDRGPAGTLLVHEVCARTPRARASLWQHLLGVALVREVQHRRSWPDDPVVDMVAAPRLVRLAVADHIWLRIVDLDRAVPLRGYGAEVRVRVDLTDTVCPWNHGRWDLELAADGGRAVRVDPRADDAVPTVRLAAADLGAAFLGGTPVRRLADAGLVSGDPEAVDALHDALSWRRSPHCPEGF